MKQIIKILIAVLWLASFSGCQKDEMKNYIKEPKRQANEMKVKVETKQKVQGQQMNRVLDDNE